MIFVQRHVANFVFNGLFRDRDFEMLDDEREMFFFFVFARAIIYLYKINSSVGKDKFTLFGDPLSCTNRFTFLKDQFEISLIVTNFWINFLN